MAHGDRGIRAPAPPATQLPNLPLITHEGKRVLFYDDLVKDKVVSLNFFYANCDEICPLVTANLAKVQKLLGNRWAASSSCIRSP